MVVTEAEEEEGMRRRRNMIMHRTAIIDDLCIMVYLRNGMLWESRADDCMGGLL